MSDEKDKPIARCETCAAWGKVEHRDGTFGRCRRRSPALISHFDPDDGVPEDFVRFRAVWPVTDPDDYCAEYSSGYGRPQRKDFPF